MPGTVDIFTLFGVSMEEQENYLDWIGFGKNGTEGGGGKNKVHS